MNGVELSIALLQFDIVFGDPKANRNKVETLIKQACNENQLDILVLPELWTTGYDLTRLDDISDDNGMQTKAFISALARKYHVNIVAGSVAKRVESKVYNTIFVFNREGDRVGEYQKVHLFRLMNEEKYLTAGDKRGLFNIEGIPSAGVICYDIRFPEWIRQHTIAGAEIVFVPAEWPTPRIEHWRTLLRSRAIESQCYVVAVNRVGSDPDNQFGGHSMIVDPWGDVIVEGGDHEGILYGKIDPSKVNEIRKAIPIYEDRRPELY